MNEVRPSSRRRRYLWIFGVAVLIFTVGGFLVAPPIIKAQLEKRASAALGRTVTVGKVRMNPYAAALTLEDLDVRLKEGTGSFLGWKRLYVNFDPVRSLLGAWTFGTIELDGFHATAFLKPDGKLNFDDIIQKMVAEIAEPSALAPAKLPAVRIGNLQVNGARADFSDQSRYKPFATAFGPITFSLTEFRTVGERGAPYHFAAVTEAGEKFEWTGTIGVDLLRSAGKLMVENIDLAKYLAYYGDLVKAEVQDGRLTFRAGYELNLGETTRRMKVSGGALQLRGVKVADVPGGPVALELPAVDADDIAADAGAMKATVGAVNVTGGRLRVQREKDGTINLLTMLQPSDAAQSSSPATAAASAPAAAPAQPMALPDVVIAAINVKDFQVDVTDFTAVSPVQLGLGGLQVALKNVTLAENAVIPVQLAFNWAPQGTVRLEGTIGLQPVVKAELVTDVAALEIRPLSPYLAQFLNARVTQGAVSLSGTAKGMLADGMPDATFEGGVTVEKFGLVDSANNEELAGFATLGLKEIKAATLPQLAVTLAEVNLAGPYARVIVSADRSANLLDVLKAGPAVADPKVAGTLRPGGSEEMSKSGAKAPPAAPADPAPPASPPSDVAPAAPALPKIEIGKIVIAGGEFSLLDRSLEPNVRLMVNQAGGTIGGVSSANLARGEVKLSAMVDGIAPVTVAGKLDPFGVKRFIEIEIDVKNMELLPFSPYSGRYAGYELQRGKLNSNLKFKLDGKQMDATDIITLNGFTFGAPVASPEATKLPVRLGVALLKDSAGQIVIDVPVSGNIDDPEVRLRKAIMRVVGNLLAKAATSPFSLLGSLLGGGGEELAFQEFQPGSPEIQPEEVTKLETVVKMLNARPELGVAIEGGYDGPADTYALQRLKVANLVHRKIWEEKHAADPNVPPPPQLQATPEEDLAMIKQLFDEKFPPGTEFGAPLVEKPAVVVAPVPEDKPGFLRRVINTITFQDARKQETQATELKEEYADVKELAAEEGVPVEEMVGRLAQTMAVTENDLRALAETRAAQVRDYFLNTGKISADRIFLTQGTEAAKTNKGPRVFLSPQ